MSSDGLVVLDRAECESLLSTQRIGRVATCGGRPTVVPVVFAVDDGDIVFRTAPGEKLIAAALYRTVVFEVDEYDADAGTGWSVNVVGTANEVLQPDERTRLFALGLPMWAGDARDRWVRISPDRITGRRLLTATERGAR